MDLESIEIVEDRTKDSTCDEGFLLLRRLQLRNRYRDGSRSEVYPCDVVSRARVDAVVALLYWFEEDPAGRRRAMIPLRESLRPPVYLRRFKALTVPDARPYDMLLEVVAGLIEDEDTGEGGLQRRAAIEALEEAGFPCTAGDFVVLGAETFASPGTADEKVFYAAARVDPATRRAPEGDGSVMEEAGDVQVFELGDALEQCRTGAICDMKTELALMRLADHLGYLPALDRFVDELPPELQRDFRPRGLPALSAPGRRREDR